MIFLCWNVRGLNSPVTQFKVSELAGKHSIDFFSLIETKIRAQNTQGVIY